MNERLVEEKNKPKFKVGDKIKDKNNRVWYVVPMEDQDYYELVPKCFSND